MPNSTNENPVGRALESIGIHRNPNGIGHYYNGGKDKDGNEIGKVQVSDSDAIKLAEAALELEKQSMKMHDLRIPHLLLRTGLNLNTDENNNHIYKDNDGNSVSPYKLLDMAKKQHAQNITEFGTHRNEISKVKNNLPETSAVLDDELREATNRSSMVAHYSKNIITAIFAAGLHHHNNTGVEIDRERALQESPTQSPKTRDANKGMATIFRW